MNAPSPNAPSPNAPRLVAADPVRASPRGYGRFGNLPDRRGEALDIFTTIFIRPALELRSPARRLVDALTGAGGRMVATRCRQNAAARRH
jgi:hypothetical protein